MAATRSTSRSAAARSRNQRSTHRGSTPPRNRTTSRPRTRRRLPPTSRHKSRSPRRLVALFVISALAFAAMGARLVVLQVAQFPRFARLAADQRERQYTFPAHRGAIYDRNGESLAISVEFQTVFTDHVHITNAYEASAKLSPVLGVTRRSLEEKLQPDWAGDQFEYLARQISPKIADKVEALNIPGIYVKPEPKRIYPSDSLGSHVVGFVNADSDALEGIELQYDELLRGRAGRMDLEQDPQGVPLPQADFIYEPAVPGHSLYLTIDKDLQAITESALAYGIREYQASAASAIILRPHTGEILAMANLPTFDLNNFSDPDPAARRNRAVTDNYEPGSAFKIVTAAAVLEENLASPGTVISVPDQIQVADRVIHESHWHPLADMSVSEIIQESSNVGTVKLALTLTADKLDKWIREFGFGSKTGLDFPGEGEGILLDRDEWWGSSIGTVPLGQGIAVTPLQMLMAYSTIANKGVWVEPKFIHSTMGEDGELLPSPTAARHRVVSRRTARQLMDILTRVVSDGTGIMAQIPGYSVAGKTGTAQKPSPDGGYAKSYIGSFVGLAPADRPEIAIIVVLDEPKPIWGGSSAAPVFKMIAEQALRHLGEPPTTDAEESARQIQAEQATRPAPLD
jgi:cell division protein FtsI (penicillin-binding protein 3)